MRFALAVLAAAVSIFSANAVSAAPDVAGCHALASPANGVKFAQILDAPTLIVAAKAVDAANGFPEYCEVEGQIAPSIGFLLRMPTSTWNGKFLMGGCGGPCGNYALDRIDPALARNYAIVVTDMGNRNNNWAFVYNNLDAMADFGYRSTHVTAVAAKEIIAAFYGKPAARNYFWGCSTGGRQAMVEAQRFPKDFEGIIAGAPVWHQTGNQLYFSLWATRINVDPQGRPILDSGKLMNVVHKAVMAACDERDGLKDGLLQDPLTCNWEPKSVQCEGADGPDCLTAAQVDVVQKIYDGARDSKGNKLYWGMVRGSEDKWSPGWINTEGKLGTALGDASGKALVMSYRSFYYAPGPDYSLFDFDYDRDPQRLELTESMYNAQNPDLRKFKQGGGKLILYSGWNDSSIPPEAAIDYYETATRTVGGPAQTTDFFRLFMLPAMNHCEGGAGGGEVDWITALENWVEQGKTPSEVTVYHLRDASTDRMDRLAGDRSAKYPTHPLNPSLYDRSRPVYAYPDVARWSGRGNAAEASAWQKARR